MIIVVEKQMSESREDIILSKTELVRIYDTQHDILQTLLDISEGRRVRTALLYTHLEQLNKRLDEF